MKTKIDKEFPEVFQTKELYALIHQLKVMGYVTDKALVQADAFKNVLLVYKHLFLSVDELRLEYDSTQTLQ